MTEPEIEPDDHPDDHPDDQPDDHAQASTAGRLVSELLDGGEQVDEGGFSLDPAAAAAKLAVFKYADRGAWMVPIVEGLIGLGARELVIETRRTHVTIRALETPLANPKQDLEALYSHALGHSSDTRARALGRIAVGVDMILGDSPRISVRLSHGDASSCTVAEYRWRAAPQLRSDPPGRVGELEVSVHRPIAAGSIAPSTELAQLDAAVRFSPTKITIDGGLASREPRNWSDSVRGEGPGYQFRAGLEPWSKSSARIELWSNGVRVDAIALSGGVFTGVIELDNPRRDLSQMKVVHDEVVEVAVAAVNQARADMRERLASASSESRLPAEWDPACVAFALGRTGPPDELLAGRQIQRRAIRAVELTAHHFPGLTITAALVLVFCLFVVLIGWQEHYYGLHVGVAKVVATVVGAWSLLCLPARRRVRLRDHGARTHAQIVDIERQPSKPRAPLACVVWSFVDAAGTLRRGSSKPRPLAEAERWHVGETITIFYDPRDSDLSVWEADFGPRRYRRLLSLNPGAAKG